MKKNCAAIIWEPSGDTFEPTSPFYREISVSDVLSYVNKTAKSGIKSILICNKEVDIPSENEKVFEAVFCRNNLAVGRFIKNYAETNQLSEEEIVYVTEHRFHKNEVLYYCPDVCVADYDDVDNMFQDYFVAKEVVLANEVDIPLLNLNDDGDYLESLNLCIEIHDCCGNAILQINNLIRSDNQGNLSNTVLDLENLIKLITESDLTCKYFIMSDKFRSYGVVGFMAFDEEWCHHMVLSAEIVGYGLESYLVDSFSVKPVFDIPKYNRFPPILCSYNSRYKRRMLVRGGCDVEQIVPYLAGQDIEIVRELNIIPYRRDHLCYLLGSVRYTEEERKKIEEEVMFVTSKSFETDLYGNTFDFFLWSSVVIMMQGLYVNKNNENLVVAYKNFDTPFDFENDIYNEYDAEQINTFTENWSYFPHMSSEKYLNDLTSLYEKLPEKTKLILITGSEVPVMEGKEKGRHLVHAEINKISEEFAETHSRVLLLDIRKFVKTDDDLTNNIRHFKNFVYRKAADELMNIIRESERQ